jgi:signal peptidase II
MYLWILLAAALVGVDAGTKYLATANLMGTEPFVIIPGWLEFAYVKNYAGAMGINFPGAIWVLSIFTMLIMIVIAVYIYRHRKDSKMLLALLTIIFAGGLGNLVERVFNGFVVDFIYVKIINFPCFNFADICVSVGCVLLAVYLLFFHNSKDGEKLWSTK